MADNGPDFNERHPEWNRMSARWKMAWDFYRGGVFVKSPDTGATKVRFAQVVSGDAANVSGKDPGKARQLSQYTWSSTPYNSYLWKHEAETLEDYGERSHRQVHFPIFQLVANIFTAGILRVPPRRDVAPSDELWGVYHRDVDMHGTDIDAFDRMTLALALVFGRIHTVTDMPQYDTPAISKAQQEARGDRPYSYHLSPLDLVDWRLDEFRHWLWAVVREDMADERNPGEAPTDQRSQYRVWYPDHWELWQPKVSTDGIPSMPGSAALSVMESSFELVGEAGHPVGRVPIDTMYACRDDHVAAMECESPLASVLDLDRDILNRLSELDELERKQAFSVLWLPESEGATMAGVDIGPNAAIAGPADGGAPQYISPSHEHPRGKWERIIEKVFITRQMSGAGRGQAERSKEERSAAALAVESEDKRNQMAVWASALEEQNRAMHRTVLAWMGDDPDTAPNQAYNKDFDLKGTNEQINEMVQLRSTQSVPPATMAALAKPVVSKILREAGVAADAVDAAMSEIDRGAVDAEAMRRAAMDRAGDDEDEGDAEGDDDDTP
jgi:hypothetical protein